MNRNQFEVEKHTNEEEKVHKINDNLILQEGMFCRSKEAVSGFCLENDVLLITGLNFADQKLHSVEVIAHPRYNSRVERQYLLDVFYDSFTVISKLEADSIREKELGLIFSRYAEQKKVIDDLSSNPEKLRSIAMDIYSRRVVNKQGVLVSQQISQGMPSKNALELIKGGNLKQSISAFSDAMKEHSELVKICTNIMLNETTTLKSILEETTSYDKQKILAVQVSTIEYRQQNEKLQEGIENLKLYSGESVVIEAVKTGESAPSTERLTMVQKALIADLELAVFNTSKAESLDIFNKNVFLNELKNNAEFVDQIFPTNRCIVLMSLTQYEKDYDDVFVNDEINARNQRTFILVRNGENIYQVFSPITSHNYSDNLFPSRTALDEIFKWGEIEITVDNLYYSTAFSMREREALHYKRFLLLIVGLDHNHKLFGEFYPNGAEMEMFKPIFQEKYFNFIHDQDGENLIGSGFNESLYNWISHNNSKITIGSMVLVDVERYMDKYNAPKCYKESYLDYQQTASPKERFQYVRIQEDEKGLYFRAEMLKQDSYGDTIGKSFTTRIALDDDLDNTRFMLLNNINHDHINQFINNRMYRSEIFAFIDIFKVALNISARNFELIKPLFDKIYEAVQTLPNLIEIDKEQLEMEVIDSINLWQTQKKKNYADLSSKMQSKALIEICDALYLRVTKLRDEVLQETLAVLKEGSRALKLTIGFDGTVYLYAVMPLAEQENRVCSHVSVYRYGFKKSDSGSFELKSTEITELSKFLNHETVLIDVDPKLTAEWLDVSKAYSLRSSSRIEKPIFSSHQEKLFVLNAIDQGYQVFQDILLGNELTNKFINDMFFEYNQLVKFCKPMIALPIAITNKKIIVACIENSKEFVEALRNNPITPEFYLKAIWLSDFVTNEFFYIQDRAELKTMNNVDVMMPNVFATSIPYILTKKEVCNNSYFPMGVENLINEADPFVFDRYINNPYYSNEMKMTNISLFAFGNEGYSNRSLKNSTKWDLYLLVNNSGNSSNSKVFEQIAKLRGDLELGTSFTHSEMKNVVTPHDLDHKIMSLLKRHNKGSAHFNEVNSAVQQTNIKSIKQVYETEIPLELEELKDFKLYKLLKQV